ncbi:hypothetical protein FACS1894179_02950 [Bacteroidia bacterium]|nr:hypothetical protein FACS1894179_02950 [Bacteroidia bacterium]
MIFWSRESKIYLPILLILLFSLSSCTGRSSSSSYNNTKDDYTYVDGDYYAEVKYHNLKTGTRSTYTLKVKIKEDKLVTIYWNNGGWLDNSHFTPPDISTGNATFTSDRDYRYEVTILEEADNSLYDDGQEEEDDNTCSLCGDYKYSVDEYCDDCQKKEDGEICPKCGNDKHSWEEYCTRCKDDIENTCSRCGTYEYGVNGGLCQNCKDDEDSD